MAELPGNIDLQRLLQFLQPNELGDSRLSQAPMLGVAPAGGFNLMEDGSLRGVLGGIGREGGGALGAAFGALFGNDQGVVDLGGGNRFAPGTGFQQRAQGPVAAGGAVPLASGLDFGSLDLSGLLGGLFGGV